MVRILGQHCSVQFRLSMVWYRQMYMLVRTQSCPIPANVYNSNAELLQSINMLSIRVFILCYEETHKKHFSQYR